MIEAPLEFIENFGDQRITAQCVYCGGHPDTRDHIPPKVFLDEPLPANVHVVGACFRCNNRTSVDEEDVACLVECARVGSAEASAVRRIKIRRILEKRPALQSRIRAAMTAHDDWVAFAVERTRAKRVFMKLARAHAVYEENVLPSARPSSFSLVPLHVLSPSQRESFETLPTAAVWPEVGSRAMQRGLVISRGSYTDWIEVQEDRYRYATATVPLLVRIVVSEYLACEVIWN